MSWCRVQCVCTEFKQHIPPDPDHSHPKLRRLFLRCILHSYLMLCLHSTIAAVPKHSSCSRRQYKHWLESCWRWYLLLDGVRVSDMCRSAAVCRLASRLCTRSLAVDYSSWEHVWAVHLLPSNIQHSNYGGSENVQLLFIFCMRQVLITVWIKRNMRQVLITLLIKKVLMIQLCKNNNYYLILRTFCYAVAEWVVILLLSSN